MGLKIKWNDDRVRATTTALLLLVRDRLGRGETDEVLHAALADFRHDPVTYRANKALWPEVSLAGPLTDPAQVAYYHRLRESVERLVQQWVQGKRQFNSLTELDNFLVFTLARVR